MDGECFSHPKVRPAIDHSLFGWRLCRRDGLPSKCIFMIDDALKGSWPGETLISDGCFSHCVPSRKRKDFAPVKLTPLASR